MTAHYQEDGIDFQYPENWRLYQNERDEWPRQISLEAPCGAFWSMHVSEGASTHRELLDQAVKALGEQYDSLEVESNSDRFNEFASQGLEANFYCLDFLVTAQIHAVLTGQRNFVFLFQAESRDFDDLQMVFRAITTSVLASQHESAIG